MKRTCRTQQLRKGMYACLFAPALPLQALVRAEPALADQPLATVDAEGTSARLNHASASARSMGIKPGMTPSQARSLASCVIIRKPAPGVERAAHQALVETALAFSATVTEAGPGIVIMDVAGYEHIHGSFELMGRAMESAAKKDGLIVRTGFAGGPGLAVIAARSGHGITIFKPGQERDAIAHMDIKVLNPSPGLASDLAKLGIRRVGSLAAIPTASVGTRLGPEGMQLHALARGIDKSIIENPVLPGHRFEECVSLDYTLDTLEPLLFLVSGAADRILYRMDLLGLCPGRITLTLELEPSGIHVVASPVSGPAGGPSSISTILHRALLKSPPNGEIRGFSLSIEPGDSRAVQCGLFGPPVVEPDRLKQLTGKLAVIAGESRVGSPEILDSNARNPFTLSSFAPMPFTGADRIPRRGTPTAAFRRFSPPVEASVIVGKETHRPVKELHDDTAAATTMPSAVESSAVSGRITRAAGPWFSDADWWTDEPQAGAFYDVEIPGRGLFRLWHDLMTGTWFVEGIWD